jgi:hypothetical protein
VEATIGKALAEGRADFELPEVRAFGLSPTFAISPRACPASKHTGPELSEVRTLSCGRCGFVLLKRSNFAVVTERQNFAPARSFKRPADRGGILGNFWSPKSFCH